MKLKNWRGHPALYPALTGVLIAFCSLLFALDEYGRVFPDLRTQYALWKCFFFAGGFAFATLFYIRGASDLSLAAYMVFFNIYTLSLMWFAPLYEVAYLECAIAAAFFRLERAWIYPTIFGLGLTGIFVNYEVQDRIGWSLPPESRSDWILIVLIMFIVSYLVQRFAVNTNLHERDRVERLSSLGHEAVRILHDVKGLSSTPFLISQRLGDEKSVTELGVEIENVQRFLRATQRLVNVGEVSREVDIAQTLNLAIEALQRRLAKTEIKLNIGSPKLLTNPNRLFSVFYNVILILSERNVGGRVPLKIENDGKRLIFTSTGAAEDDNRDLRERVITSDLLKLNWKGGFRGPDRFELVLPG